jgi:hypothetical protein
MQTAKELVHQSDVRRKQGRNGDPQITQISTICFRKICAVCESVDKRVQTLLMSPRGFIPSIEGGQPFVLERSA